MSDIEKNLRIEGFKSTPDQPQTRYPIEQPEGVDTTEFRRVVTFGEAIPYSGHPGAVSLTQIQTQDLISEGEIDTLVTGEYTYTATIGNVGYDSAVMSGYAFPSGSNVNWLRSIYWNDVPLVDSQNNYNFQSIQVSFTPGLPNGALTDQLSNELTVSKPIGERLRYGVGFYKVYRIYDKEIKAFEVNVRFNQLSSSDVTPATYGDTDETQVQYAIFWKPLYTTPGKTPQDYPGLTIELVRGKITNGYIRNTRVNLVDRPLNFGTDFLGWEIKIIRDTPDSINSQVRNQTFVDSITEVYGDIYTYPNSAIVSAKFSAEFFSQIPARAFDTKLLKVQIPNNYDPILKTYAGDWDGTFADDKQWTDNPAWCFYDLVTNKRYGLGNYIDETMVDKWTLYEIAQYCDTMVPDGEGGIEPRFTCNLIINSREQAYKVLNDMASIFRAMLYYFGGTIVAVQDSYKEPLYQFTNANVEDGNFIYSTSSKRNRHTAVIVRYNDKNNLYVPAAEYVQDFDGIRRYGVRELQLTAFGCTSRGQAIRFARWALASEINETETVSFVAGPEGAYLRPGDIIQIQDNNRTVERLGGRVNRIYDPGHFLLDSQITGLNPNSTYYFSILTPSYSYEPSQVDIGSTSNANDIRRSHLQKGTFLGSALSGITGLDGIVRSDLTITPFDNTNYYISGNPIWLIEGQGNDIYANQWADYRVLGGVESSPNKFQITALQYESGKFSYVESGINFQETSYQSNIPGGPSNLQLKLTNFSQGTKEINYSFTVSSTINIETFKVFVKKSPFVSTDFTDSTYQVNTLQATDRGGNYFPSSDGIYYFRVYAYSHFGTRSTAFAENNITVAGIVPLKDAVIGSLVLISENFDTLVGGTKKTSSPTSESPTVKWQVSTTENGRLPDGFSYRISVREPSNGNIPSKNIYFQTTGYLLNQTNSLNYQYKFNDNLNSIGSISSTKGPFRNYDLVVEGMTYDGVKGNSSAGGDFLANGDSDFSNANGYDIIYLSNPSVPAPVLTDPTNPPGTWQTDQWITSDGSISINFIKNNFPGDLAGGYAYYSTDPFNSLEALGQVSTTKTIGKYQIQQSGNPFVIPAGFSSSVTQGYIALSLYDNFDKALQSNGANIEPGLLMSNVVGVTGRGTVASFSNSFFSAWAEISAPFAPNFIDSSWTRKSFNISNIVFDPTSRSLSFYFKSNYKDTNYVVFGNDSLDTFFNIATNSIAKFTDHFTCNLTAGGLDDINKRGTTAFFGILYNGMV